MIFKEDFTLSTLICDEDDRLTIWGLARLFQNVAGNHSDTLGVGFNGLNLQHKAWVLTHVYYNVLRFPSAGEKLTVKTWPKQDNGLIAPRDYQLIDADGNICASCASNWVVIDMDKRRVCRLKGIIECFEMEDIDATKFHRLEKLQMPEEMSTLKKIDIPYSSLDHTRHVNNAEYMKWICDSIKEICKPRSLGRPEISEFEINYIKETKYDDPNVTLWHIDNGSTKLFRLTNSNGIAVNAKVLLSNA